jgi:glyceraldehyde-3-phosphate dehydrogenase (NADP+)
MNAALRIAAVRKFAEGLRARRDEIVQLIIWEICKTVKDAEKEVDRTIRYIEDTLATLEKFEAEQCQLEHSEGLTAQMRRAPYGVVLCAGPFNYPFNETYTTLIPALVMGADAPLFLG